VKKVRAAIPDALPRGAVEKSPLPEATDGG
jgi:hypothetical protein